MQQKQKCVVSYSGGKDSSLALYHMLQTTEVVGLIAMLEEQGQRTRSHGMDTDFISAQAQLLGLPIITAAASWQDYEAEFAKLLAQCQHQGVSVLATGDLDVPAVGSWHEQMAHAAGLQLQMPLLQRPHQAVVDEFIDLGFVAIVVTVNLSLGMRPEDLGREFNREFVQELQQRGIDVAGEGGEFHTSVIDGPIFAQRLAVRQGSKVYHGDYGFLPLYVDNK
ncbi:diphthine--ammonia ligase [Vitreoscilla massiliensis]|uniref:Diphthine--ammonia ligase n=1 Tax=Vitreoscilla massiliensis TaxID=1689272 RepID=A0ABY4E3X0_9NEIS|nr:diphthine--ammonia ligase [Vitreoscilla massiliensis]UOO90197.1 diphthine--ammonia ligase [Vitreoscilla massiliensis]